MKKKDVKQWTVESKKRKLMMKKRKEERGIEGPTAIVEEQTAGSGQPLAIDGELKKSKLPFAVAFLSSSSPSGYLMWIPLIDMKDNINLSMTFQHRI